MRFPLRFGAFLASAAPPIVASAQTPSLIGASVPCAGNFVDGQFAASCIPQYIGYVIGVVFSLTGAIFLIMVMIGGYQYVLGAANVGSKENGIARIRSGIVGFLVSALAFFIVDFVVTTLVS